MTVILPYAPPKGSPLSIQDTVAFQRVDPDATQQLPIVQQCPAWDVNCSQNISGAPGDVFHRGEVRSVRAEGERAGTDIEVKVNAEHYVYAPGDADLQKPACVHLGVDVGDGVDLTPQTALDLAAALIQSAAEILGLPAEGLLSQRQWWLAYGKGYKDAREDSRGDRLQAAFEMYQATSRNQPAKRSGLTGQQLIDMAVTDLRAAGAVTRANARRMLPTWKHYQEMSGRQRGAVLDRFGAK